MIDHLSAKPKYIQLAQALEELIKRGEIKPGERIYSEHKLCEKYGVSRITVRQAFSLMESKDLIYTVHGKGTFVKVPTLSQSFTEVVSFSKMLSFKGLHGGTVISSYHSSCEMPKAARALLLRNDERLFNLNLIGNVEGAPVAVYESYFSKEHGELLCEIAKKKEREGLPFTTLDLYKDTDIRLSHVEQTVTAETTDSRTSLAYGFPCGTALIVLESVIYSDRDEAIEYKIARYRADIYSFRMRRQLAD